MWIVMLGKPGSGKGTQSSRLSERLGIPHLSSGEILRTEIRDGTPFGKQVEAYVARGEIGPAELIASMILGYIATRGLECGFILDGFPRTPYQARELDRIYPPRAAVLLSVTDAVAVQRLSHRLTCESCGTIHQHTAADAQGGGRCNQCGANLIRRADDEIKVITARLETFKREVTPVITFYRESGRLIDVNAAGDSEAVLETVVRSIGNIP